MDVPWNLPKEKPQGDLYAHASEGHADNFWEWFQLASWDIRAFFGDKDAASHASALRAVNAQKTPEDRWIYTAVTSQKVEFGGIVGAVRSFAKGIYDVFLFLLKNIKWVIVFAAVAYFGWMFLKMRGTQK